MFHRELELIEAIRRDDLAYVVTTRHQKPFTHLMFDDTPAMLLHAPSPAMAAAYYGSTKCFHFFYDSDGSKYLDQAVSSLCARFPFFASPLHPLCRRRWKPLNFRVHSKVS
jgi:hypothetical protein